MCVAAFLFRPDIISWLYKTILDLMGKGEYNEDNREVLAQNMFLLWKMLFEGKV